jgi:hypothetical protein
MCWLLVATAACTEPEPDRERMASISELPKIQWMYLANPRSVAVTIHYDPRELGACAILGPDFEGRVNDTPMVVTQQGSSRGDDDCHFPTLELTNPPPAASASITLGDHSRSFTIPLEDQLVPRSVTLVPEGPWHLSRGQTVTIRWSPATDLGKQPSIRIKDLRDLPITIQGDLVTLTVPDIPFLNMGDLEFWLHRGRLDEPKCAGCLLSPTPRVIQPFTYMY